MLKNIFSLFLWLFVSVFVLSVCYVIGVFRNLTDTSTVFFWIFVILVSLTLKLIVDCIHNYFSSGKYMKAGEVIFQEKKNNNT